MEPKGPVDAEGSIGSDETLKLFLRAKARKVEADKSPIADVAGHVQDYVVALRELRRGYNAHAIALLENGDLFVYDKPCHPLAVADRLVAGSDAIELATILDELHALLESAAGPELLEATPTAPSVTP